jgi:MYND finger
MNASTSAEEEVPPTCSNPGCDQPGTKQCGACKTTPYCGPSCQTADWPRHKEECPGHLRKMGMAHLQKAVGFDRQQNWIQTLRYADLALTKLKLLKDRRLDH